MAASVCSASFKVLPVKNRMPLRKVLEANKITFEKGKAFYEMTKGEIIQDYKQVVVMRKSDGVFITGEAVKEVLKIPLSMTTKFKLDLDELPDFSVFVQSTSYNRVVVPDTSLLYKTDTDAKVEAPPPASTPARRSRRGKHVEPEPEPEPEPKPVPKTTGRVAAKAPAPAAPRRGAKRKEKAADADEPAAKHASPTALSAPAAASRSAPATPKTAASGGASSVEIAFSFDTTGSMYACLGEVRRRIQETIQRLQRDIPGIRIAVIAHGDYCDAGSTYVTKYIDFTTDGPSLCNFVRDVDCTGGGDFDECYELVLREAHSKLSWNTGGPDSSKSLVVIGDATPHEPNYPLNRQRLDWRAECASLKERNIRVYAVQALNRDCSTSFYRELARLTDGFHLMLDQFSSIVDFMLAICYREQSQANLEQFEDEIRNRGMNRELHRLFDSLSGRTTTFTIAGANADGLVPVNPSRFQVLSVDTKCSIKDFVQRNSLIFKAGRGFYEFTKPETISHKKEVVLVDKVTGDMFTGAEACRMIGAGGAGKISPASLAKYRVFVQSTSYNRVLVADTGFLYEVDSDH